MSVAGALEMLGGVATRQQLIRLTSRAEVERALRAGAVITLSRGRYASPTVGEAVAAAHRLTGTVSDVSAALHHGWAVVEVPELPHVTVPRNRKVPPGHARGVVLHRADLNGDEVRDGVTTADRTLLDCGRRLDDEAGLAVFDSALRDGYDPLRLAALVRDARGPRSRHLRRLAREATPMAANPFESVLRALADVPGLHVRAQVPIFGAEFLGCPDLVDVDLKIAIEADSFQWHGGRAALARDARRYNWLVVNGWLVLRFAWEDVMHDHAYVRAVLEAAVAERTDRALRLPSATKTLGARTA